MTARKPMATSQEVADYLQVSVRTLYDWRLKGTGPRSSKVGIHLRYRWADVDKWLDEQAEAAA